MEPVNKPTEEKEIRKVVNGSVKTKKPSAAKRLSNAIIADDMSNIKEHIIWDVGVPYIKDLLRNIGISTIDAIFGGGGRYNSNIPAGRYNYNKVSLASDPRTNNSNNSSPRTNYNRGGYQYDDIILDTRSDAEIVLDRLQDIIVQYGMATIGDLYELVGVTPQFTDNKWGWQKINGARIDPAYGGGWIIKLPEPRPLT